MCVRRRFSSNIFDSLAMPTINVLAKNVVKSFNFLLRDEALAPDDALALAEAMTLLATHYKNREKTRTEPRTAQEQEEAHKTELLLRERLEPLGLDLNIG
jgi:hypothetical protein